MTYSKTHKLFSNYLEQPDALTNPEKYLGPNYQDVLDFWIYLDTLSEQEREKMWQLYCSLDEDVRKFAIIDTRNAAYGVVGEKFSDIAWWAAYDVTKWIVFSRATEELIVSHKLLDQNKTLTSLQLCIKS